MNYNKNDYKRILLRQELAPSVDFLVDRFTSEDIESMLADIDKELHYMDDNNMGGFAETMVICDEATMYKKALQRIAELKG